MSSIDLRHHNKTRKINSSKKRKGPTVIITDNIPAGDIDVKDITGTEMSLEEARNKGFIKDDRPERSKEVPEIPDVPEVLDDALILVTNDPKDLDPTMGIDSRLLEGAKFSPEEIVIDPQGLLDEFIEDLKIAKNQTDFKLIDQDGKEITGMGIIRNNVQIKSI